MLIGEKECFVIATLIGTSMACSSTVEVMWRVLAELKREFQISDALSTDMEEIKLLKAWLVCHPVKTRIILIFDDVKC